MRALGVPVHNAQKPYRSNNFRVLIECSHPTIFIYFEDTCTPVVKYIFYTVLEYVSTCIVIRLGTELVLVQKFPCYPCVICPGKNLGDHFFLLHLLEEYVLEYPVVF